MLRFIPFFRVLQYYVNTTYSRRHRRWNKREERELAKEKETENRKKERSKKP